MAAEKGLWWKRCFSFPAGMAMLSNRMLGCAGKVFPSQRTFKGVCYFTSGVHFTSLSNLVTTTRFPFPKNWMGDISSVSLDYSVGWSQKENLRMYRDYISEASLSGKGTSSLFPKIFSA